jgi:hypothetical protein
MFSASGPYFLLIIALIYWLPYPVGSFSLDDSLFCLFVFFFFLFFFCVFDRAMCGRFEASLDDHTPNFDNSTSERTYQCQCQGLVNAAIAINWMHVGHVPWVLTPKRTKEAKMAFCVFGQAAVNAINFWIF